MHRLCSALSFTPIFDHQKKYDSDLSEVFDAGISKSDNDFGLV